MARGRTMSLQLRIAVAKKCNFTCQICGEKGIFYPDSGHVLGQEIEYLNPIDGTGPYRIPMEFDHIVPFSKGGKTELDNLQLLCRKCNKRKKDKI